MNSNDFHSIPCNSVQSSMEYQWPSQAEPGPAAGQGSAGHGVTSWRRDFVTLRRTPRDSTDSAGLRGTPWDFVGFLRTSA